MAVVVMKRSRLQAPMGSRASSQHPAVTTPLRRATQHGPLCELSIGGPLMPTADEGWFSDMSSLVSNEKWVFGAAGVVLLFGVISGIFLIRRARHRLSATVPYSALPGDDVALSAMPRSAGGRGAPRTK